MATREIAKQVKNAVLYTDGTIRLDNVRLSYPHIGRPFVGRGDDGKPAKPRFGTVALLNKQTHKEAKDLVKEVIQGILTEKNKGKPIAADKWFLRDGDQSGKEEHAGSWTVSAGEGEDRPPRALDERRKILSPEEAVRKFYGGCYGNVLIRPWWQDNNFGKRVNAGLLAVQFAKDGESFGEGRIADEDVVDSFDGVGDDESGFAEDEDGGL